MCLLRYTQKKNNSEFFFNLCIRNPRGWVGALNCEVLHLVYMIHQPARKFKVHGVQLNEMHLSVQNFFKVQTLRHIDENFTLLLYLPRVNISECRNILGQSKHLENQEKFSLKKVKQRNVYDMHITCVMLHFHNLYSCCVTPQQAVIDPLSCQCPNFCPSNSSIYMET